MGVGVPDFREKDKWKNRTKTGKCSVPQGFDGGFSYLS